MTSLVLPPSLLPFATASELQELEVLLSRATPAGLAATASRGRWRTAPHLDLLNDRLVAVAEGRCPRLLITMPPRHGKSYLTSHHFPAWFLGVYPDRRVILTSYEADFAAGWGRKARDVLEVVGPDLFGVAVRHDSKAADRWDIEGHTGGMTTAGVGGPITGKGADLLIIDDPVKNAEEAASPTYRQRAWDWYTSTAYTRLEPGGAVVLIQTRWHEDDLAGRVIANAAESGESWDVLNLPALAEGSDPLGRRPGQALWPERFDEVDLARIRATLGSYYFTSLYQQRPAPAEGDIFRRSWFSVVDAHPATADRVRYWDKAGTEGGGAHTAGVLMSRVDDLYHIEDVVRGQWSALEREMVIRQTAEADGKSVAVWVEQEPGSGGKESAEATVRNLAGFIVHAERVTGDKVTRARPFAAQAEAGNVRLVRGGWNAAFLDEAITFPNGKFKDQIDAASGAFNKLAVPRPDYRLYSLT
jgi:predicted phage terminase large subunit-like protein